MLFPRVGGSALDSGYFRLVFLPLCVLAIEAIGFWTLKQFLGSLDFGGSANAAFQTAKSAAFLTVSVHNIVKALVFAGVAWLLLFGSELYKARNVIPSASMDGNSSKRFAGLTWALHLLSLLAVTIFRGGLNGYGNGLLNVGSGPLNAGYALAFACFVCSGMRLWAPFDFWRRYIAGRNRRVLLFVACAIALAVGLSSGISLNALEPRYSELFFSPTAHVATSILQMWGYRSTIDIAGSTITVDDFAIFVDSSCLGYEGISVAFAVLSTYLYVNKAALRFPQALLILPAAFLGLFVGNCVRVAVLLAIGASWSADVAVTGFHSVAGSINLFAMLACAILALNQLSFFATKPRGFAFDLSQQKMQLLPLVVLIAVAMLSLLVSSRFEWLYPLRVIAVGGVLLAIWPRLGLEKISRVGVPTLVGIGVFALWLLLVPEVPEQSTAFANALFSASSSVATAWIVLRVIGAIVIVPLAEELAFRGYLFDVIEKWRLLRRMPNLLHIRQMMALLMTSIGFGVLHSAWLAGIVAGLAYGVLRLYRNRVMDAVIAHSITNSLLAIYVLQFRAWSLW